MRTAKVEDEVDVGDRTPVLCGQERGRWGHMSRPSLGAKRWSQERNAPWGCQLISRFEKNPMFKNPSGPGSYCSQGLFVPFKTWPGLGRGAEAETQTHLIAWAGGNALANGQRTSSHGQRGMIGTWGSEARGRGREKAPERVRDPANRIVL